MGSNPTGSTNLMRDVHKQISHMEELILYYGEKIAKDARALREDEKKKGYLDARSIDNISDDSRVLITYCDQLWILKVIRDGLDLESEN